ncbi:hypothetical protein V1281_001538 [Nitrobacteraceae bacterium AZCC 2161]
MAHNKEINLNRSIITSSDPALDDGGESGAGNPSYAGYDYQIAVTVWVALHLMLAKEATESIVIEPPSHEDIEARIRLNRPIAGPVSNVELVVQVKSRSTAPWSSAAFAKVLLGEQPETEGSKARIRPLEMLADAPDRHYVFVTNESVDASLKPHAGDHLFDFRKVEQLPPHTRATLVPDRQSSVASRLLICGMVTDEALESRTRSILSLHGHVPLAKQPDCIRALRLAVHARMLGTYDGRWTKTALLELLIDHGGSVLPSRMMDHYVRPASYDRIKAALMDDHVVVIAGPSGTGKTLTADIFEAELRRCDPPFEVITETGGPGAVRAHLQRIGPVLFHLRDPWGSNRLTPEADRWSDELPKLLTHAGPSRKFLVTSRSDIMLSAGQRLSQRLSRHIETIEIEDYGRPKLAEIYDSISRGLHGRAADSARKHKSRALKELTRPYEIDRFLEALTRNAPDDERSLKVLLQQSQIDAVSDVIAEQVRFFASDATQSTAVIWSMLSSRGAVTTDVFSNLCRRIRATDPSFRPDVDGLLDFLVAGRNLRRTTDALSFYHPRAEDGLRIALDGRRPETEHTLGQVLNVLCAWDGPGEDWGIETALGILRAAQKLKDVTVNPSDDSISKIDSYLVSLTLAVDGYQEYERALDNLAQFGSPGHLSAKLARVLVDGGPRTQRYFRDEWVPPELNADELAALASGRDHNLLLDRFIRNVLPHGRTSYGEDLIPLMQTLHPSNRAAFSAALDEAFSLKAPSPGIAAIAAGLVGGDGFSFDGLLDRLAEAIKQCEDWILRTHGQALESAREHEVDATYADHLLEEPGEMSYNARQAFKVAVAIRYRTEGSGWIPGHPHSELISESLAEELATKRQNVPANDLVDLIKAANGYARSTVWRAASAHWSPDFETPLSVAIQKFDDDDGLRTELLSIIAKKVTDLSGFPAFARKVASVATALQRLQLVRDIMVTRFDLPSKEERGAYRRSAAEHLLAGHPEAELGGAVARVLLGTPLGETGRSLSHHSLALLPSLLSSARPSLAGILSCIAAAAEIDPTPSIVALLATGEPQDGVAAIKAAMIFDGPELRATLEMGLKHRRYAVRCAALEHLVATVSVESRPSLTEVAKDRSSDVRLAWAELMNEHSWSEAVDSLVGLLSDTRNFASDYPSGDGTPSARFRVATSAARALGQYAGLPEGAIAALVVAAADSENRDPYVAAHAMFALKDKDNPRVVSLCRDAIEASHERGPTVQAHAAAWVLFDRAAAGLLKEYPVSTDLLAGLDMAVAGPLLMAIGICGGETRDTAALGLVALGDTDRSKLIVTGSAAARSLPEGVTDLIDLKLASRPVDKDDEPLTTEDELDISQHLKALRADCAIDRYRMWLLCIAFGFPLPEAVQNIRDFKVPDRSMRVLTMRSMSRDREEPWDEDAYEAGNA